MAIPFTPGFINQFGQTVSSAYPSYASYDITPDTPDLTIALGWAQNFQPVPNVVAAIMDINVTASSTGIIVLPDATQASVGTEFVFNNYSAAQQVQINNIEGGLITTIAVQSPESTQASAIKMYITDNSTPSGSWGIISYGGVAGGFSPSVVCGPGLIPNPFNSNQIMTNDLTESFATSGDFVGGDRAKVFIFTGNSSVTRTLPPPAATGIGNGYYLTIVNNFAPSASEEPVVTVNTVAPGSQLINGTNGTVNLAFGTQTIFFCDGANWWTFQGGEEQTQNNSFPDGTVTTPGINYTDQTGTGFYRYTASSSGNQVIGIAVNGTQQASVGSNGQITATSLVLSPKVSSTTFRVSSVYSAPQNQAWLEISGTSLNAWYLPTPTDGFYFGWGAPNPTTPTPGIILGKAITSTPANAYITGNTSGMSAQNVVAIRRLYVGTATGGQGTLLINGIPLNLYLRASGF